MRITRNASAVLVALAGLSSIVQAQEPLLGVWKLNAAKSPTSATTYQSHVITLTSEDGMVAMTEDNVTAKGMKYRVTCKIALDGKDYPMTGSIAGIELISGTRLSPNSSEIKAKRKDGSVVGTYWMTISSDGTVRITLVWPGADLSGPPARVVIHERQ